MASEAQGADDKIYALVNYEDPYVQPLLVAALTLHIPAHRLVLLDSWSDLPSPTSPVLQWLQYESIDFEHIIQHTPTSLANSYIIRKALIRKHYLSTTVANWVVKHPDSVLRKHVKPSVEFEVDYAEFLDDALIEAWELHESWARGEAGGEKEWWILKPGMSERGQGIRLFSSEEELSRIFEAWDPPSDDEEEEGDETENEEARSDAGTALDLSRPKSEEQGEDSKGIITSQLRHFIAQPYIHPPLLLHPSASASNAPLRKFHIRTYVLAVGALRVYVYRPMLALFAARPYAPPLAADLEHENGDALRAHLTNTCLQATGEREGSVAAFWALPDDIPAQPSSNSHTPLSSQTQWKDEVFTQICAITGELFEAAARGMSIHFQSLPNAFEIFGLDFMVGIESDGELRTWLLEVNAFPDFRQTGSECKGIVEGLMQSVVKVVIRPFFEKERISGEEIEGDGDQLVKVREVDLGRR